MQLKQPFGISARLLPSIKVAGCTISMECKGYRGNRAAWTAYFDGIDGQEYEETGLESSPMDDSNQSAFGSLLCFLSACGEGLAYQERTGRESENADLFCPEVAQWVRDNQDELSMLQCEIEETPGLIEE